MAKISKKIEDQSIEESTKIMAGIARTHRGAPPPHRAHAFNAFDIAQKQAASAARRRVSGAISWLKA
jgi:hypothetical protein